MPVEKPADGFVQSSYLIASEKIRQGQESLFVKAACQHLRVFDCVRHDGEAPCFRKVPLLDLRLYTATVSSQGSRNVQSAGRTKADLYEAVDSVRRMPLG